MSAQKLTPEEIQMDREALIASRRHVGEFQWLTVLHAVIVFGAFSLLAYAVYAGWIHPLVGGFIMGVCGLPIYVPLHEGTHNSIQGPHKKLTWVNSFIGVIMGNIIMFPFFMHRKEHMAHHGKTNVEGCDPDRDASVGRNVVAFVFKSTQNQFTYFMREYWPQASFADRSKVVLEIAGMIATRVAFAAVAGIPALLMFWILGSATALVITGLFFNNLVHPEPNPVGRYVDCRSYPVDHMHPVVGRVFTWLYFNHNYHVVHHLFPKVPYYRIGKLFHEIRPILEARGSDFVYIGKEPVNFAEVGLRFGKQKAVDPKTESPT